MGSLSVRIAVLVAGLAAIAWLGLSIRSLDLDARGQAISQTVENGRLSDAELERARAAYRDARRFNVDQTPLMHEAFLLTITGRARQALALTRRIVGDEPDNRDAWVFVYVAARAVGDRGAQSEAARTIRTLDPRNAQTILRRSLGG